MAISESTTDLPGEIWKRVPLPLVQAVILASNLGRVMSQTARCGDVILKQQSQGYGRSPEKAYFVVKLRHMGRRTTTTYGVHRLVLLAFKGPPPTPQHEAAHEDGNPRHNVPDNLNWKTVQENALDRHRHGTIVVGGAPNARLSPDAVREILRSSASHMSEARRWSVSQKTVMNVRDGLRWRHIFNEVGGWLGRDEWERTVAINTQWARTPKVPVARQRLAAGLCVQCGAQRSERSTRLCEEHASAARRHHLKWKSRQRSHQETRTRTTP